MKYILPAEAARAITKKSSKNLSKLYDRISKKIKEHAEKGEGSIDTFFPIDLSIPEFVQLATDLQAAGYSIRSEKRGLIHIKWMDL